MKRNKNQRFPEHPSEFLPQTVIPVMPEAVWIRYAWLASVQSPDPEQTRLVSTNNGTLRVLCTSPTACKHLSNADEILDRWRALSRLRPLPEIIRIEIVHG